MNYYFRALLFMEKINNTGKADLFHGEKKFL